MAGKVNKKETRTIFILKQEYTVPDIHDYNIDVLQKSIQRRRRLLSDASKDRRFLGLIPLRRSKLSDEEQLHEMERLVDSYEEILSVLSGKIDVFRHFFTRLAMGMQDLFQSKIGDIKKLEDDRQKLVERSRKAADPKLQVSLEDDTGVMSGLAVNLTRACLLILRKIDLSWRALQTLMNDKQLQHDVLGRLTGQVQLYRDVYRYRKARERLEAEVREITRIALDFESILRENMGPFQTLIEEIGKVDDRIGSSLVEIEKLSLELETGKGGGGEFVLAPEDETLLNYLVHVEMKKDALESVLDKLGNPDTDSDEFDLKLMQEPGAGEGPVKVETTLNNVTELVSLRLAEFLGEKNRQAPRDNAAEDAETAPLPPSGASRQTVTAVSQPEIVWKFRAASGIAAPPVLTGDGIAVFDERGSLYFLNGKDGKVLRTIETGCVCSSDIAVAEGGLYFGTREGKLIALSAADGTPDWEFETGGRITAEPVLSNDRVYAGSLDGHLYCLERNSGKLVWKAKAESGVALPSLIDDERVYFGSNDGHLYAVSAETGDVEYTVKTGSRITGAPVTDRELVYFGSHDGNLYAVSKENGEVKWKYDTRSSQVTTPLVISEMDLAVFGAWNENLYFVEVETGRPKGIFRTKGIVSSRAEYDGSLVITADGSGRVSGISPGDREEVWSFELPEHRLMRPVLDGERVLLASKDGYLRAVRKP